MADTSDSPAADRLDDFHQRALDHTRASLEHMARYGIEPEGRVALFLPPDARQQEIHRMPYTHAARQVVTYTTEPGEFTALCPFSGLPDSGTVRIEYVPGSWLLELKSLKYYLMSWRHVGAAQRDDRGARGLVVPPPPRRGSHLAAGAGARSEQGPYFPGPWVGQLEAHPSHPAPRGASHLEQHRLDGLMVHVGEPEE